MSPHRLLQSARDGVPLDTATITAATAGAVFASLFSGANVVLFIALGITFAADQVFGMGKTYLLKPLKQPNWFDGEKFNRGLVRKGMYLGIAFCAGIFDMLASYVPAFGPVFAEITPATKIALILLITGQCGSILRNISMIAGPEAKKALAYVQRQEDAINAGVDTEELPARRGYDPAAIEAEQELRAGEPEQETQP